MDLRPPTIDDLSAITHASITVDSDNPTGAARLYRALGFVSEQRSIISQIEVT